VDTPGHPKLRSHALTRILPPQSAGKKAKSPPLEGVIFVADATGLNTGDTGLGDAGEFLHDILLSLQRRYERTKTSRTKEIPVLVAAAKDDLFTAAPAALATKSLEKEIGRVRSARARGLMGVADGDEASDDNALGGWQDGDGDDFSFATMEEYGIKVTVVGGNVREGEKGVARWWSWIGDCL
jgi:signal recognition particle receptor subunit beta